ncbi:hypothetical protein [Natronobeatus ordinarius]|uniref:hypothetical protein n=1 Tax=Natronobeatus ordinarius TaxID=2963433 RepID=UPI0020CFC71F|nr:hypothetical protein [Natronobeatus ordinarius]
MTDPRVRFTAAASAARREYGRYLLQRSRAFRETCPGYTQTVPLAGSVISCCNGPSSEDVRLPTTRNTDRTAADYLLRLHDDA